MNTAFVKKLIVFFSFLLISASSFAQTAPWYIGAFSAADDGSGKSAYLFIFPQGLFFIDPSMSDGKVWQLETKAEVEYSDYSRRPATKNDTSGTVFLGGVFPVDMSAKTIQFYFTEEQLKKHNL